MATRTIEVSEETYDRLRAGDRNPSEVVEQLASLREALPSGRSMEWFRKSVEDGTYPLLGMTEEEIEFFDRMDDAFLPEHDPE